MVLFKWQSKEPELVYNHIGSIPFDDNSGQVSIQQIEVINTGDEVAQNVLLSIDFNGATIEKSHIQLDSTIKASENVNEKAITLDVENLNPSEKIEVSALIRGISAADSSPTISLRANGVVGKRIGTVAIDEKEMIGIAVAAAYSGLFAFVMMNKTRRDRFLRITQLLLKGRADLPHTQNEQIASAFSLYGMPHKTVEYRSSNTRRSYWVEADYIGADAINSTEEERIKSLAVLNHLAEEIEAMAPSSKAIVYYNIARVQRSMEQEYMISLEKARELDPAEINRRLRIDPLMEDQTRSTSDV